MCTHADNEPLSKPGVDEFSGQIPARQGNSNDANVERSPGAVDAGLRKFDRKFGGEGFRKWANSGLYIHIPFCVRKCAYCDFLSFDCEGFRKRSVYCDALLREIRSFGETCKNSIDTVYVGGGTPTALPVSFLCEILAAVRDLPLCASAEITIEANPGTVDFSYLSALKNAGANRLSFGLQTTHPHLLRTLGRIHTMQDFAENFRAARIAGFTNINVDLMFALPAQTFGEWAQTLEYVVALSPEHISCYSLTPAENTPLFDALERNEISLPSDEEDRNMYHHARRFLAQTGYTHYEISNFAKSTCESRHNINCWTMKPYIGLGLGAHSFDGTRRWHNTENMDEYLAGSTATASTASDATGDTVSDATHGSTGATPCAGSGAASRSAKNLYADDTSSPENLTPESFLSEEIILGLRLMRGVCENKFAPVFPEEIAELTADGLLQRKHNRICLTERGMDFANRVFVKFLR